MLPVVISGIYREKFTFEWTAEDVWKIVTLTIVDLGYSMLTVTMLILSVKQVMFTRFTILV